MIKGIHHIGASVPNLDETLAFYRQAADLPQTGAFEIKNSPTADRITGLQNASCQVGVLNATTAYLELFETIWSCLEPI